MLDGIDIATHAPEKCRRQKPCGLRVFGKEQPGPRAPRPSDGMNLLCLNCRLIIADHHPLTKPETHNRKVALIAVSAADICRETMNRSLLRS
jgi:hypothetical protein